MDNQSNSNLIDLNSIVDLSKEQMENDKISARNYLKGILKRTDPVKLFVAAASWAVFAPPEASVDTKKEQGSIITELLAYELYPYFKNPDKPNTFIQEESVTLNYPDFIECFKIFEDLLYKYIFYEYMPQDDVEDNLIKLIRCQAKIVRGKAYPWQTERRIREVQGKYDKWFESKVNISPTKAVETLRAIIEAEEYSINEKVLPDLKNTAIQLKKRWKTIKATPKHKRNKDDLSFLTKFKSAKEAYFFGFSAAFTHTTFMYIPTCRLKLSPILTETEWDALITLIGLTISDREKMSDKVEVRNRPLYVLPDRRVILADISNAFDALWEAFDKIARQDQDFYNKRYQRYLSNWLEDQTANYLSRIFPKSCIFKTLDYPDPEKNENRTTEIDIAILWGQFLLLIEAKAKQFRIDGQLGDKGRLYTDLDQNIKTAFSQALRAGKYIDSTVKPIFKERNTGRELTIDKSKLHKIFYITVSLHQLSGLTAHFSALKPYGFFRDNEFPYSISEGDLEIITEFCPGPEAFLHYIDKRMKIHGFTQKLYADELDLFGAYLDSRFADGCLLDNSATEDISAIIYTGYSNSFDKMGQYCWDNTIERPEITFSIPQEIKDIISHLRTYPYDNAIRISMFLLNLPLEELENIVRIADKTYAHCDKHRYYKLSVICYSNALICIILSKNYSIEELTTILSERLTIEAYNIRAQKAIGFGMDIEDPNPFTVAIWHEKEWVQDTELDEIIKNNNPKFPIIGRKNP